MSKQKKQAWGWCSKFIRLRDSIEYCKKIGLSSDEGIVQCCTCPQIRQWEYMDAGHFLSRGVGGNSGVYFDERNINTQCKSCNGFQQGNVPRYYAFMLAKYGQGVIDQLKWLDKNNSYKYKLVGLELYYKQEYQKLVKSL